jgi:hypothetical protein
MVLDHPVLRVLARSLQSRNHDLTSPQFAWLRIRIATGLACLALYGLKCIQVGETEIKARWAFWWAFSIALGVFLMGVAWLLLELKRVWRHLDHDGNPLNRWYDRMKASFRGRREEGGGTEQPVQECAQIQVQAP